MHQKIKNDKENRQRTEANAASRRLSAPSFLDDANDAEAEAYRPVGKPSQYQREFHSITATGVSDPRQED